MLTEMVYGLAAMASALTLSSALSACNTMTGVGKDVEAGGQRLQEGSGDAEDRM
jgi:predicted small secreted protein